MDWLSIQFVAAKRGPDTDSEGWMQLLVFIVLAVFWAIGGIMKARSAKAAAEKGKKPQGPGAQERPRPSFERLLQAQPEKARSRPAHTQSALAQRLAQKRAAAHQVQKAAAAQPSAYGKEVPPMEIEKAESIGEIGPMEAGPGVMEWQGAELGTSEQLRAAILHYEIFGKCVALRGSQEQIWLR